MKAYSVPKVCVVDYAWIMHINVGCQGGKLPQNVTEVTFYWCF